MATTTSIKRLSAFLLPTLLICSFLVTPNYAIEPATISSYGTVNSPTNEYLNGVWVSDTGWNTYGSYFSETQTNMIKNAGGELVCLAIDKVAWETNPSDNVLEIPFRDYITQLVEFFKPGKTILCLHIDSSYPQWLSAEKTTTIKTPVLRQAWIQWGKDMIEHCEPWGILIMDEPPRSLQDYPITQAEYWDFANECVTAFRTVDPSIACITYGGGGSGNRYLDYFFDNPLTQGNIYYTMTCYYDYSEGSEYRAGNRDTAGLYNWLDNKYGPLKSRMIPSVGLEATGTLWQEFMEDAYDYNRANTAGIMQWACAKRTNWNLIGQDRVSWSEIGEFWDYAS